jgi:hypothetical protein
MRAPDALRRAAPLIAEQGKPQMRTSYFAGLVAAAALVAGHAQATLMPTLEIEVGPIASIPITSGSVGIDGVSLEGLPVVGSTTQPVMQLDGSIASSVFNPLQIDATEFNLPNAGNLAQVGASISGTLAPKSSISWSVYLDAGNNPLGTGTLIASDSFSDPSPNVSLGFFDPVAAIPESLSGPFAFTEFVTVNVPTGETVTFDSSASATFSKVPEPASFAMFGAGLLALGLTARPRRTRNTP